MSLEDLFKLQKEYNDHIRKEQGNDSPERWTETYLLGMISEMDELLREINWKKHRKESIKTKDMTNIAYELADLTKYILSLWEVWGFSSEDFIEFVSAKSRALALQREQERLVIPTGSNVLITDIDGTLGDWRASFLSWMVSSDVDPDIQDHYTSLLMDYDLSMRFPDYYNMKERFESQGGYRNIQIYDDAAPVLKAIKEQHNAIVIAVTARPAKSYHRIWMDTWNWIEQHQLAIDKLIIGSESRILLADELIKAGNTVVIFDDNPSLIRRAANSEIPVCVRRHLYNKGLTHKYVRHFERYSELDIKTLFQKQS